jgi:RNA polymerase sigma factor (sigma-70 family)
MMHLYDIQLIDRILAGDTAGYAVLVDRHKDMAYTIAYRIVGSREDAEEVVQDAFIKAFQALQGFRRTAKFATWLYRIVYNAAVSKQRQKKHAMQPIDDDSRVMNLADDDDGDVEERHRMLEMALMKLPEEERVLLTLYYIEDSNVDDIHQIMGISKPNVKIRLFRARKKLHELMTSMVTVYT